MALFSPMDLRWFFCYFMLPGSAVITFLVFDAWRKTYSRLPLGPSGWPLIGNLLQVGNKPNESFFQLAIKYGPLMILSLGMKTTVVVSSSAMAREVLKTHDHIMSGRIVTQAAKALSQHKYSISFSQYGSHWRMFRRVSNTELFSVKKLEALQHLRRDQVNQMIHQIFQDAVKGKCVDIGHISFQSSFNLLGKIVFRKAVEGREQRNAGRERKNSFQEYLDLTLKNFLESQEVIGRSKSLRRSSSGGVSLSKKGERDPRSELVGRIKVETFKYFEKSSKLEESVISRENI